jgi:CRISPR/Cas system CSM-associated protein Csm4 (group 5 of RAMP superfamily)|uniref:Uncharacterized protein n=1 Tax=Mycetohabitans sp. TaxID=2571162 RepID=A0A6B9HDZ6_9BURK|nr:hypothetical protein [Mycetohabitans sp.]QGY73004.1 hypothetical protein [Mycetohabitans sp.]
MAFAMYYSLTKLNSAMSFINDIGLGATHNVGGVFKL